MALAGSLCLAFLAGCGSDPVSMTSALGDSDVQYLDRESFDGVTPLRVRTQGIGISVSSVLHMVQTAEGTFWTMNFESSRALASVLSYGNDGELGQARLLDSYKFEVRLDGSEISAMLAGEPLNFMLHADEGEKLRFFGTASLSPMLVKPTGSSLIWLDMGMDLVDVDGTLMLKGHAKTSDRIRHLSISSDAGIEPESISTNARGQWSFSFLPASVRDLLASPETYVYLTGEDADGLEYNLRASPVLAVQELGITNGDESSL